MTFTEGSQFSNKYFRNSLVSIVANCDGANIVRNDIPYERFLELMDRVAEVFKLEEVLRILDKGEKND